MIPVEIAIQRGFFTYFVEDREVLRDAYGQALRLLMERDECDARRAREDAPLHAGARPGHRVGGGGDDRAAAVLDRHMSRYVDAPMVPS